jgi:hypothetical protein
MSKDNAKILGKLLREMLYTEHGGKEQFEAYMKEHLNKPPFWTKTKDDGDEQATTEEEHR